MCPDHDHGPARHLGPDTCLDLVHGYLAPAARTAALAHARACHACELLLHDAVTTHEIGRARLAESLREGAQLPWEPATAAEAPPFAPRPASARAVPVGSRGWLAAAGIVVAIGAVWLVAGRPSPDPSPAALASSRLPVVDRSAWIQSRSGSGGDSLVLEGIAAYARGDFAGAIRLLGDAPADERLDLMRRAYLASAQLEAGRPDDALATLEDVDGWLLPEPWRTETDWTRLVALTRVGRTATADSFAHELARGAGPIAERASRYLAARRRAP